MTGNMQAQTVPQTMDELRAQGLLSDYSVPAWARKNLSEKYIPTLKLNFSNLPTPVQQWNMPPVPEQYKLFIKRDDLNGSILGGNKIRKLEFSIAKALQSGCNHIITWGGLASNHCRTTALVCAQLGLKCTLLQTSDSDQPLDLVTKGNVLLSMLAHARCLLIPACNADKVEIDEEMERVKQMEEDKGDKVYILRRGGTQPDAIFSYIDAFEEMRTQSYGTVENRITDIFVTSGSGGTACSLAIASKLSGLNIRIHACRCWGTNKIMADIFRKECEGVGLAYEEYKDFLVSHDFLVCGGYGKSCDEIDDVCMMSPSTTGIAVCTTYTGKSVATMLRVMKNQPNLLKGNRVLFVHTGGIPGLWGDSNLAKRVRAREGSMDSTNIIKIDEYFNASVEDASSGVEDVRI